MTRALSLYAAPAAQFHGNSLLGILGGVLGTLLSPVTAGVGALANAGVSAICGWVLAGAQAALAGVAAAIGATTEPRLESAWFSATYWRVAGIAALLTLPFLFAAAIQALLRSDLSLLLRATFGYLPLSVLGVALAAPLTTLMLAATDQMCSFVAAAGSNGGVHLLSSAAVLAGGLAAAGGAGFFAFVVGLLAVAASLVLLLELLIRAAAVYVVMLVLPLAFAGCVWPARRVWAVRTIELLVSLILSKFVMVAVLSLGGAAYGDGYQGDPGRLLMAMALIVLATFAPLAALRLIPFTELAAGAHSALHSGLQQAQSTARSTAKVASKFAPAQPNGEADWLAGVPDEMRTQADQAGQEATRSTAYDGHQNTPSARAGADADPSVGGTTGGGSAEGSSAGVPTDSGDGVSAAGGVPQPAGAPQSAGGSGPTGGPEPNDDGDDDLESWAMRGERAGPAAEPGPASSGAERVPGMGAIWQARNWSWEPMRLGPDAGGPEPSGPGPSGPEQGGPQSGGPEPHGPERAPESSGREPEHGRDTGEPPGGAQGPGSGFEGIDPSGFDDPTTGGDA